MDKEKILLGASANIDTIKAHINRLKRHGYKIHSLDIDMLKSKAYELYDQILALEDIVGMPSQPSHVVNAKKEVEQVTPIKSEEKSLPETEAVIEEKKEESVIETEVKVTERPIEQAQPLEEKEEIEEEIETPVDEFEDVDIEEHNEVELPVEEEDEIEPQQVVKKEAVETPKPELAGQLDNKENTTAYDLFSESAERPVAEKLTTEETSIADKMQKSHIANIREAIGINDKFLFINELFNGDMGRYNKILDDINSMTTKKGIDTFLLELKIQSQWAEDNEAFVRFKEIIDRKFI